MLNIQKTIELVTGGLTNPQPTWESYLAENPGWQKTAMELTVPLAVAAIVVGWLLSVLLGGTFYYGYGHGPLLALILAFIGAAISVTVMTFVLGFFAGTFGGQADYNRAFAGVSLAYIPGWVGVAAGGIPFIGPLLQLIGVIVGLVFLYKIIPLAVGVPEEKRVLHFIVTIVVVLVVQLIIGVILGAGAVAGGGIQGL